MAPPTAALVTGPRTIWNAYKKNEVGADNRFRDKRLRIASLVNDVSKDALNIIVVKLAATPAGDTVSCRFGDEWATQVGAIERGQLLGVECTGRGMILGEPQLGDCSVTWTQPADVEAFASQLGPSEELCVIDKVFTEIESEIDAGRLPDGGPISEDMWKSWARLPTMVEDDRAQLKKLGVGRLNCDHPAVIAFESCDFGPGSNEAPQCSSDLVKRTWKHIHRAK